MNKTYRIKKNEEIKALIDKRTTVGNQHFTVYYQRTSVDSFRFAVSVNKKWGTAPERNKMKRRIRDVVSRSKDQLHHIDFLIVTKATTKGIGFEKIKESLSSLLMKLVRIGEQNETKI
jgi:ribonuclease P protein component